MANILIGSLPGVWIGTHLVSRVPTAGLRITLGVVLFASAFGVMQKAGADYGLGVTIGVPLLIAAASWFIHSRMAKRQTNTETPSPPLPPTFVTHGSAPTASTQPENPS
jgi:hypothetical protein